MSGLPRDLKKICEVFRCMDDWTERVYVKDRNRRFCYVNKATAAAANLSISDMIGTLDENMFADPHLGSATADDESLISGLGSADQVVREELETWKDGSLRAVLTRKTALRNSEGDTIGLVGMTRDLTVVERNEFFRQITACGQTARFMSDDSEDAGFWVQRLEADNRTECEPYCDAVFRRNFPEAECVGRFHHIHKEDRTQVARFLQAARRGKVGHHRTVEYRYRADRNSQEYYWMRGNAYKLCIANITTLVVTHLRIGLPNVGELLSRTLLDHFPGFLFVKDGYGKFKFANDDLLRRLELTLAEVINKTDRELGFPTQEVEDFKRGDDAILVDHRMSYVSLDERLTPKSQSEELSLVTIKMPLDAEVFEPGQSGKHVLGISIVASDEWKKIRESKRVGEAIMKHSPAAIYLKDTDCRYVEANDEFCTLLGLSRDKVIGKTAREVFTARNPNLIDEMERHDQDLLTGKFDQPERKLRLTKLSDDSYQLRLTTKFLLRDELERPWRILGISRDVSSLFGRQIALERTQQLSQNRTMFEALSFKRQNAVILFCDIRNFSRVAAALSNSDEVLVDLIERLFRLIAELSDRFRFVFRFLGDGAMVIGGILDGSKDNAPARMADFALELRKRFEEEIQAWHDKSEHRAVLIRRCKLKLGIGIHVQDVCAGLLLSNEFGEFNVFGDPVVLAQRLESAAAVKEGHEILVSHPVYEAICSEFDCGPREAYATKEESIFAHRLLGRFVKKAAVTGSA